MNTIGPDISFYQDDNHTPQGVDFSKMATQTEWLIIRAGQNVWVDSDFKSNWSEAKKHGLARGSYWFYDSRAAPKRQAEIWVDALGTDFGELPLFMDIEDTYGGVYKGWKNWYTFLVRLRNLLPRKEIFIYTGYYYWLENTVGVPVYSLDYFKQYPLWIAAYNSSPQIPRPWTNWEFWQYTDNGDGEPYGVESKNIDLNYFNGDIIRLRERFGLDGVTPPEPPVEEHMEYSMNTIDTGMRIRDQHSTFGTVLKTVQAAGTLMYGTDLWIAPADGSEVKAGDRWVYVTKENGVDIPTSQRGWMAQVHKGVSYCNNFLIIDPNPTPIPPVVIDEKITTYLRNGLVDSIDLNGVEIWKKGDL